MRRALVTALAAALGGAAPAGAHITAPDPFASFLMDTRPRAALAVGAGAPVGPHGVAAQATPATPQQVGDCGPGGRPEPGLQGQVPKSAQDSGDSKLGYRCNLEVIGSNDIELRGANFQLGWYEDCAYVGLVGVDKYANPERDPANPRNGIAVIDASDPSSPRLVRIVSTRVDTDQHEAVEVNQRRGMLVVETGGLVAQYVEIYDVSKDCTNPEFKGRYDAGAPIFHGMRVSDDGRTVYATDSFNASGLGDVMHVIDVTDMSRPRLLLRWNPVDGTPSRRYAVHDLEVSADGNRAYMGAVSVSSVPGVFGSGGPTNQAPEPSVVVLDTSDIQARKQNPELREVGTASVPNFGHALQRGRVKGRPYLFHGGEAPFGGARPCPWAWGNVFDISDESAPRAVSEIKLEVNDASRCPVTGPDEAVYSIHYNGVDDERDTHLAFYTYYTGGLRVFDVRDPAHPKEIAYIHTPPVESTEFRHVPAGNQGDAQTPTWDSSTSVVRYRPETGHIWFVSIGGGLQIARLTGKYGRPNSSVTLLGSTRKTALRRKRVRVRVACSASCHARLALRVGGRRSAKTRVVSLPEGGSRVFSMRLLRGTLRRLRTSRAAARRAEVRATVRDGTVGTVVARPRGSRRLR